MFFVSFCVVVVSGLFWTNGGPIVLGGFVLLVVLWMLLVLFEHRERHERLGSMPPLAERDLLSEIARVRNEGAWIPTKNALAG